MATGNPSKTSKRTEQILENANRQRAQWGLDPVEAGFDYAKAVRYVIAENPSLSWRAFARSIGCSPAHLRKIMADVSVPNHITGELLWGLLYEVYGDKRRRRQFLSARQTAGGRLLK
jgi:hypothetical protein